MDHDDGESIPSYKNCMALPSLPLIPEAGHEAHKLNAAAWPWMGYTAWRYLKMGCIPQTSNFIIEKSMNKMINHQICSYYACF